MSLRHDSDTAGLAQFTGATVVGHAFVCRRMSRLRHGNGLRVAGREQQHLERWIHITMSYTLFYSPGTASLAVHWMLLELGVGFEVRRVDLDAGEQHSPEYLRINPSGR